MSEILFDYQRVHPTSWVYLSTLLMIGLYFKFGRFWSVRNLDLVLLALLAPGLLLVHFGRERQWVAQALERAERLAQQGDPLEEPDMLPAEEAGQPVAEEEPPAAAPAEAPVPVYQQFFKRGRVVERLGFIWLFAAGALLLVRLLLDSTMVRRPLLEPNLTPGGLIFIGAALFVFLMANVIVSTPTEDDLEGARAAAQLLARQDAPAGEEGLRRHGPGYRLLNLLPGIPTMTLMVQREDVPPVQQRERAYAIVAKTMAILCHAAVVAGMVLIGYWHFDNLKMGVGAAVLYLMLPYTAQMTGRVDHVLPAALMIWALVFYRRPLEAGMFMGLAIGVVYYPIFLLPLWLSFYWQRGKFRFACGVAATIALLVLTLVFTSASAASFWAQFKQMFGLWRPVMDGLGGFWNYFPEIYRLPLLAAFVALSFSFALWPAQKNLGTLISCSAAVMVAAQFWHGHGGGMYMAWYLPLLLLTIFRPNLEDRIALAVLGEGWLPKRRNHAAPAQKAA